MCIDHKGLLTHEEAAAYLAVSPRLMRRLVADHTIARIRVGARAIRYSRVDLDAYIDRHRVDAL
jgi:excisionase family DNA binding protein